MLVALPCLVLVLFLPGYFLLSLLGVQRGWALLLAPMGSVALYGIVANAYSLVGVSSNLLSVFIVPTAVFAILAVVIRKRINRNLIGYPTPQWGPIALAAALGLAVGMYTFVLVLPRTDAVFQGWDNVTHLNQIRSFLDSGNWSSLRPSNYLTSADAAINPIPGAGFYPSGWHEVCALVVLMSGATVAKVVNAANYMFSSLVYPIGAVVMLQVLVGRRKQLLYCGAVVSVSFSTFPWMLLTFGPIFPNLAAFCLIPIGIVMAVSFVKSIVRRRDVIRAFILLLICVIALGIMQPNALFTLAVLLYFYFMYRIRTYRRRYKLLGKSCSSNACANVFALVCIALWTIALQTSFIKPLLEFHWYAFAGYWQELINILFLGYSYGFGPGVPAQIVLALMVFLGVLLSTRDSGQRWIAQTYAFVCIMLWVCACTDGLLKTFLCGIWYTDPCRIASMASMAAVPLAALGLDQVVTVSIRWYGVAKVEGPHLSKTTVGTGVVVVFLALNFARSYALPGWEHSGIQDSFTAVANNVQALYAIDGQEAALTQSEKDFAQKVLDRIPADSLVINNPTDGSLVLYGIDGMRCYYRTATGYDDSELNDSVLIRTKLKDIASDTAVRDAVNHVGARYVLVLDASNQADTYLSWMPASEEAFGGITGITDATPGFKTILSEGSMRLYEIEE
ncbi:MAG: DUF6541 family protein [Atopobiaceae bacterium]